MDSCGSHSQHGASQAGKVTEIRIEKPKDFVYVAGNYIFIIIPSISRFEAHPFTLTSAPDEPYLSLHIRCVRRCCVTETSTVYRSLCGPNS